MGSVVVSWEDVNIDYQATGGNWDKFISSASPWGVSSRVPHLYPHFGNVHRAIPIAVRTFYIQTGNHPDISLHYRKNNAKMYKS